MSLETQFHSIIYSWMPLQPFFGPWPLTQFRNHFLQPVGLLGRVISPSQDHYIYTGQHKHKSNAYTHQTSMPSVGFEPTIPASERAKTVHALDRAATVIGTRSSETQFYILKYTGLWLIIYSSLKILSVKWVMTNEGLIPIAVRIREQPWILLE
jgi:hypothetical protein